MKSVFWTDDSRYYPHNRKITYVGDPWYSEIPRGEGGALNSMTANGHELMHAFDHDINPYVDPTVFENNGDYLEPREVSFGNYFRDAYSLSPMREKYGKIKGDFHQFSDKYGKEKISDFTSLGANEDNTSFGYSFTKTTTIREKGLFGKVKSRTVQQQYIMVSLDSEKNISFQIFDNEED